MEHVSVRCFPAATRRPIWAVLPCRCATPRATEWAVGRARSMRYQLPGTDGPPESGDVVELAGVGGATAATHAVSVLFRGAPRRAGAAGRPGGRGPPTAEDVVQDVFARLCAKDRLPEGDGALAYVRAAVLNGCRSVLRRRAGRAPARGRARSARRDAAQESAEHEAMLAEDRRQVLAALAGLPRRRREVLVLRYWLGLPEAEIAPRWASARAPSNQPRRAGWPPWPQVGEQVMTRTEERLADALDARRRAQCPRAAGLRRRDRPSRAGRPGRAGSRRWPRRSEWPSWWGWPCCPAGWPVPGTRARASAAREPDFPATTWRCTSAGGRPVVRSTATGRSPRRSPCRGRARPRAGHRRRRQPGREDSSSRLSRRAAGQEQIYRFRLTRSGRVTGFAPVPGGMLGRGQYANALAASADGSRIAVAVSFYPLHVKHGVGPLPARGPDPRLRSRRPGRGACGGGRAGWLALSAWKACPGPATAGSWSISGMVQAADDDQRELLPPAPGRAEVRALAPGLRRWPPGQRAPAAQPVSAIPVPRAGADQPGRLVITAVVLTGPVIGTNRGAGFGPRQHVRGADLGRRPGRSLRVLYRRHSRARTTRSTALPTSLRSARTPRASTGCSTPVSAWALHQRVQRLDPTAGRWFRCRPHGREADEAW